MQSRSLVALSALAPMLLAATEPVRVPPSSKWVLDYAEDSCKLSRAFGAGDKVIVLSFESEAPGFMDMLVIGRGLDTKKDEVTASFLPNGVEIEHGRPAVAAHDSRSAVFWTGVRLLPKPLEERVQARIKAAGVAPHTGGGPAGGGGGGHLDLRLGGRLGAARREGKNTEGEGQGAGDAVHGARILAEWHGQGDSV